MPDHEDLDLIRAVLAVRGIEAPADEVEELAVAWQGLRAWMATVAPLADDVPAFVAPLPG